MNEASTDTEYSLSDGTTLDLLITDVSCLTNPSAIRSKGSKDSKYMDRQSSSSSSVMELVAKKSDASSSQLSEAAAPLIAGDMRLNFMSDEMSKDIKHQEKIEVRNGMVDLSNILIGAPTTRMSFTTVIRLLASKQKET